MASTMAMMVASTGRSLVTRVCRADDPLAYSTTSPRPAPTASMATTKGPTGLPSASAPRTSRSLSPESSSSLRVATTVPTTRPRSMARRLLLRAGGRDAAFQSHLAAGLGGAAQGEGGVDVGVRPRDDVHRDQLADAFGSPGSRLGRRL